MTTNTVMKTSKKIKRTSDGLRDFLFDTLDCMVDGSVDNETAYTRAKVAAVIVKSAVSDLAAAKHVSNARNGRDQPQCLADLNLNLTLGSLPDPVPSIPAPTSSTNS